MNNQLSKEVQTAQRLADRQAARADRLLAEGLRRLREGKVPTKAQLPFVQQYILSRDDEVKAYKKLAQDAQIDKDVTEEHHRRLISKWNAVIDVIRKLGVELYAKADENHGWQGEADGVKGGQEGYASLEEALRDALKWRVEQGRKEL